MSKNVPLTKCLFKNIAKGGEEEYSAMNFKKSVAFLASLLVLLTLAPTAAASSKFRTTIKANCLIPDVTIQVVVPTESQVYVNPRSLPVKIGGNIVESQITCTPVCVENQTEVPLAVSATVTGTVKSGSNMILSSTSTKDTALTSKKAFIYFEMKSVDDPDGDIPWDDSYNPDDHILVWTTAKSKTKFLTLGAKGQEGRYGAFRLAGDCVENPSKEWTTKDGVDVKVSFTFTPVPNEAT